VRISFCPQAFSTGNEEIAAPPIYGFLIGIYLFYENWSTGTFRKNESNRWAFCYTYKPANLFINMEWRLLLKIWYRAIWITHLGTFMKLFPTQTKKGTK
jgi:hypothetical protein